MTKIITSLFDSSTSGQPRLTWELDGVMIAVLLLIGLWHLLPIPVPRRNKMVLWTILLFFVYLGVLLFTLLGLVVWEAYHG